jgi:hypothetical protein
MLALTWFGVQVEPSATGPGALEAGASSTATAFQAFSSVDILLVACIILFVVLPLLGGGPVAARVITGVAVLAIVLIAISIITPPGHGAEGYDVLITTRIGAYIGLLFAVLALIGGFLAMRQASADSRALTQVADSL